MARLVGITHVALEVGDLDEALEFYGTVFELTLRGRIGDRMAFVDMGDQFLALSVGRSQAPDREGHVGWSSTTGKRRGGRSRPSAPRSPPHGTSTSATRGATTSRSSSTPRSSLEGAGGPARHGPRRAREVGVRAS